MNDDNRPTGPQDRDRAGEIELTNVVSRGEAKAINKKLVHLGEAPVQDATETKIALAAWKVHDAVAGLGMITVFIALTSAAVALSTTQAIAGWAAFATGVVLGAAGTVAYNDKRNWEAAKAVLEHRLGNSRS